MRTIVISRQSDKKYLSSFAENGKIIWQVTSYVIVSHEIMVDWIEQGKHPDYRYT